MPLVDPRPDSPDHAALRAVGGFDRRSLQRPSLGLLGQAYSEVRQWCRKTGQWQTVTVHTQHNWALILEPLSSAHLHEVSNY